MTHDIRTVRRSAPVPHTPSDRGYTLVELVLVVVILGVLTSATALFLTGVTTEAAETGCLAERHQLDTATEQYFAGIGARTIAPTGTDHDRFERTMVAAGVIRSLSSSYDIAADGALSVQAGSNC